MVEQHENAVRVPHARQAVLEAGLQRELVHRLGRVVMAHRAVDARLDHVARVHGLAREVVPRQQLFRHRLCHYADSIGLNRGAPPPVASRQRAVPLQYTDEDHTAQCARFCMKAIDNGATRALAQHAATLQFDALPAALVELIKQCVLDTLGVAIGASGLAPEAKTLADYVRRTRRQSRQHAAGVSAARRRRRGRRSSTAASATCSTTTTSAPAATSASSPYPWHWRSRKSLARRNKISGRDAASPRSPPAPTSIRASIRRSASPTGRSPRAGSRRRCSVSSRVPRPPRACSGSMLSKWKTHSASASTR